MNIYVLIEFWVEDTNIIGCYIDKEQCVEEGKRRAAINAKKGNTISEFYVEKFKEGDDSGVSHTVWSQRYGDNE